MHIHFQVTHCTVISQKLLIIITFMNEPSFMFNHIRICLYCLFILVRAVQNATDVIVHSYNSEIGAVDTNEFE